jgi:protein-tyrosine phosphatase
MRQIQPHRLWVGHAGDSRDFRALFGAGIEAVVQLAVDEPTVATPRELVSCRFPLLDGIGNRAELLSMAIRTVAALIRLGIPTLVSCGSGLSRSPTIAAAALSLATGQPPDDCLRLVAEGRPSDVTPGLWNEVKEVLASLQDHAKG